MQPATKSMPGPRSPRTRFWGRAIRSPSARVLLRRPATPGMLWCASSPSVIGWRAFSEQRQTMAKILIAEDEEALRSLVARGLVAQGHAVTVAPDGAEALEALGREPFDLLLADIK